MGVVYRNRNLAALQCGQIDYTACPVRGKEGQVHGQPGVRLSEIACQCVLNDEQGAVTTND